jgi:hypothetical protein
MCIFCWSLFVFLYFFVWPLCCLSFFDLRILITSLISSNSSHWLQWKKTTTYDVENAGLGLGQTQTCGRVKQVNDISLLHNWISHGNAYINKRHKIWTWLGIDSIHTYQFLFFGKKIIFEYTYIRETPSGIYGDKYLQTSYFHGLTLSTKSTEIGILGIIINIQSSFIIPCN